MSLSSLGDGGSTTVVASTRLANVSGVSVTSIASNQFKISWSDLSTDNGYRIERSADGSSFAPVGTVGKDVTSYTDNTVTPLNEFYYRVVAINNYSESTSASSVVFGATPDASSPLPSGWTGQDIGAVGGPGAVARRFSARGR